MRTAEAAFLVACELDVAVRKPGNVSRASPGHGMRAPMFIASSRAAAPGLFERDAGVGQRIEVATAASMAAAGCNTNLGIVLLCAPLARAAQTLSSPMTPALLRKELVRVLEQLDLDDTCAAYRAIALANPGGLGDAAEQDVRSQPSVNLRGAMALAAHRDRIALQYRSGFADLFEIALPALPSSFSLSRPLVDGHADVETTAAVQGLYLTLLSAFADSHIVRKHGDAVAHNVMSAAQRFLASTPRHTVLDDDATFVAWDDELKASGINPGTSADLTVATLLIAGITSAPLGRA